MIIYKITNMVNGKVYIGQTIQPLHKRWRNHISQSKRPSVGTKLARAIRKYGSDSFSVVQIAKADNLQELNHLEEYFIKEYNTVEIGYNLNSGGDSRIPSPETRAKMSESQKRVGNQPPHTPESIEKMRQSKIGKKIIRESNHKNHKRSRWCWVNNTLYSSPAIAAEFEGVSKNHLLAVLKGIGCSYTFTAQYAEDPCTPKQPTKKAKKPVTINGVTYSSLREAVRQKAISKHKAEQLSRQLDLNNQ